MNNHSSPYTSGRGLQSASSPDSKTRIAPPDTEAAPGHPSAFAADSFKQRGPAKDQALASAALKKYEEKAKMPPEPTSASPAGRELQLPSTTAAGMGTASYSTQISPRPLVLPPITAAAEDESRKRARIHPPAAVASTTATAAVGNWTGGVSGLAQSPFHMGVAGLGAHGGLAPGVPIMPQANAAQQVGLPHAGFHGMPLHLPSSTLGVTGLNPLASMLALRETDLQANRLSQFLTGRQGVDPGLFRSFGFLGNPAAGIAGMPGMYGDLSAFGGNSQSSVLPGTALFGAPGTAVPLPLNESAVQAHQAAGSHMVPQHSSSIIGGGGGGGGTKRSRSGSKSSLSSVKVEGLLTREEIEKLENLPESLPALLALPEDEGKLSAFQLLLRNQIEAFTASSEDVTTHARGRNRPVTVKQVGIRCRHCKNLPPNQRTKGSVYFPFSLVGLYQAAQNMGASHFQGEVCTEMPRDIQSKFVEVLACKSTIGAGKAYWARAAQKLGLIDTDKGIRFVRDLEGSQGS